MGPISLAVHAAVAGGDAVSLWGCERCGREDRMGGGASDETNRRLRGCDEPAPKPIILGGKPFDRCPWSVPPEAQMCVGWWSEWKALGVCPYGNPKEGLMHEPAFVKQAITFCEGTYQEIVARETKARNEEAKRAAQKPKPRGRGR